MARSGWKRGARAGNYTDMQLNIACRIRNGFGEEGNFLRDDFIGDVCVFGFC